MDPMSLYQFICNSLWKLLLATQIIMIIKKKKTAYKWLFTLLVEAIVANVQLESGFNKANKYSFLVLVLAFYNLLHIRFRKSGKIETNILFWFEYGQRHSNGTWLSDKI